MRWWPSLGAFVSGAATVLGFAPFEWSLLPIFTLAALFVFWRRADSPRQAALLGFLWGMGCFLVGASWVYVSMHDVGGMAMPLAGLATSLFCAYLALFPACAGWLYRRFATGDSRDVLLLAGVWTLTEWLRGWLFTGFPWLAIGYSQTSGPLAGFAPLVGVYGVGLLLAGISAWLACQSRWFLVLLPVVISVLIAVEQGLHSIKWSQPIGEPITVSLLQGNIPQSLKWEPEKLPLSMETYARLATKHPAQLIVLPETAIPLLFDRIPPDFLQKLTARGPVLIGSAMRVPEGGYTNSAIALTPDLPAQTYAKGHLVPFGEYVPRGFAWFLRLIDMPMGDFNAGPAGQKSLNVSGQRVMPNICYEDLFGEEIAAGLNDATLLVNLSNTAWFGDSLAQPQHLQIARMRALETARPMLRATNTGMTAAIAPDGRVTAKLLPFVTGALTVSAQGYTGITPYVRVGNWAAVLLALAACLPAALSGQRKRKQAR